MSAVSLNVGRKLVDDASRDAILGTVGRMAGDWGIVFLAECDAHLTSDFQHNFGTHYSRRFLGRSRFAALHNHSEEFEITVSAFGGPEGKGVPSASRRR